MERASDRIAQHIERERAALRSNLKELDHRIRSAVDWRHRFRDKPGALLGVAFSGGLLIALTAGRRTRIRSAPEKLSAPAITASYDDHQRSERSRTWESIRGVLIGMATSKLREMLANLVLGFREQSTRRAGDPHPASTAIRPRHHRRDIH